MRFGVRGLELKIRLVLGNIVNLGIVEKLEMVV